MISVTDQMGSHISLEKPAKRVVSLVPSQTELLYYLGCPPIGQTVFCIHPSDQFKSATKIGGTKKLQLDKIRALKPDLIIGNKEENVETQIESLKQEFPVWMSDVNTLSQALEMIETIGHLIGKQKQASHLNTSIETKFSRLITSNTQKPSVVYLIWNEPYFGVGNNTFIHDLLEVGGFTNALSNMERYPELSLQNIKQINPDYLFLSSEPFPFSKEHQASIQAHLPTTKVVLVDGEMFSWYGNRLLQTPEYINRLFSDIRSHESKS